MTELSEKVKAEKKATVEALDYLYTSRSNLTAEEFQRLVIAWLNEKGVSPVESERMEDTHEHISLEDFPAKTRQVLDGLLGGRRATAWMQKMKQTKEDAADILSDIASTVSEKLGASLSEEDKEAATERAKERLGDFDPSEDGEDAQESAQDARNKAYQDAFYLFISLRDDAGFSESVAEKLSEEDREKLKRVHDALKADGERKPERTSEEERDDARADLRRFLGMDD